jgi:hypothetical protein
VDNCIILLKADWNSFALEEFGEVFPVVLLLLKFETVVKLVHLQKIWVVAGEDFGKYPAVAQVALWVCNLVGQVQRLDPYGKLAGKRCSLSQHNLN